MPGGFCPGVLPGKLARRFVRVYRPEGLPGSLARAGFARGLSPQMRGGWCWLCDGRRLAELHIGVSRPLIVAFAAEVTGRAAGPHAHLSHVVAGIA